MQIYLRFKNIDNKLMHGSHLILMYDKFDEIHDFFWGITYLLHTNYYNHFRKSGSFSNYIQFRQNMKNSFPPHIVTNFLFKVRFV